jgi:hypothetical protein
MLIWLLCGIAIFIIAILGDVICPRQVLAFSRGGRSMTTIAARLREL